MKITLLKKDTNPVQWAEITRDLNLPSTAEVVTLIVGGVKYSEFVGPTTASTNFREVRRF